MIRNNISKISQKDSVQSYHTHTRGKSSSVKSNNLTPHKKYKKNAVGSGHANCCEKVLTQTTSSKVRKNANHSPGKSFSSSKKDKIHHILTDKISTKSMRKGRLGKQKTFMMQSLNIPHIDPLAQQQFIRNNSQQLTSSNHIDPSLAPALMTDVLVRTRKVFEQYQNTCSLLRRQQRGMERELKDAKNQISSLQKKLSLKRSREL